MTGCVTEGVRVYVYICACTYSVGECVWESECVYVRLCACMFISVLVCEGVHVCAFASVLRVAVSMLVCAYLCERM